MPQQGSAGAGAAPRIRRLKPLPLRPIFPGMIVFGIACSFTREVMWICPTREEAEARIAAVLAIEPFWTGQLWVKRIDLLDLWSGCGERGCWN